MRLDYLVVFEKCGVLQDKKVMCKCVYVCKFIIVLFLSIKHPS